MFKRLIGGEARPDRCDPEQDAARLTKVDRAEVEAVDNRRRMAAALNHALAPSSVNVHRRCPGDVMDGASTTGALGSGAIVGIERAALLPPNFKVLCAGGR